MKRFLAKVQIIEVLSTAGSLQGGSLQGSLDAFLVRDRGISPLMKTPHILRRPPPGIEPANYTALRVVPTFLHVRSYRRLELGAEGSHVSIAESQDQVLDMS